MSSNLVSNVTITGNLLVQGSYSNVASLNTGALSTTFLVQGSTTAASTFKIAGGRFHTAVVMSDGTMRTFGYNDFGQLGVNDTTQRNTPVQITVFTTATAVACGWYNTAVLLADGTVRTIGDNRWGQLGVNDNTQRNTPVTLLNITSATAVACGKRHAAVILADGTVRTFGLNDSGQLGISVSGGTRQTPVQVFGISSSATAVACGFYHTAVLLADGTVRTFGSNGNGALGINVSGGSRETPVQVFGISSSATAVSCGRYRTAVLLANGTVQIFGDNNSGELGINVSGGSRQTPVQVFGISSSAVAVATGRYQTTVLLADGTVRTFGRNEYGELGINLAGGSRQTPVQVWGISSSASAVTLGNYHTAVLLADGSVRTFGNGSTGQLGVGDTASRLTPVQVVSGFTSVLGRVAGGGFGMVGIVMGDGTVKTFGQNSYGQLGLGDTTNRLTPVQVSGLTSANFIASCFYHTAVVLADGTVRTFGRNSTGVYGGHGALGINSTDATRNTPVQVWGISSIATAVACGSYFTAVLLADGTVRTFGQNGNGNLGVDDTTSRLTPVTVLNISTATAVACGFTHTAVLLANGAVMTFGNNTTGQLGINVTSGSRQTPVQVSGITTATAVAGGGYYTAVLLADGTVRTFGQNTYSQLGINITSGTRQTPVQVFGISSSAVAIACQRNFMVIILADGTVRSVGRNYAGELGIGLGGDISRQTPVQVFGISSSATAVACGIYHTAILLADGTLRTVGSNANGNLGVGDTVNRLIPVKVGVSGNKVSAHSDGYFTAVILKDGTVRTFGQNSSGQLGVNDTTNRSNAVQVFGISSSATAVACGGYFASVLLADGTVRTFGSNGQGQLGINVTGGNRLTPVQVVNITSAISITGGFNFNAILLSDGTVRTFGRNNKGQLGVNDTVTRQIPAQVFGISSSAVAIASGTYHTAVVLADGTVRTFGKNDFGQLGDNTTVDKLTPVQVFGISSSAVAVACGHHLTAVLLENGTVRTFGSGFFGGLGVNDTSNRQAPVQVWGISSSAVAVACGSYGTAVLLQDGTVRTFGSNAQGQLGVNDTTQSLTPVQVWGISSSATAIAFGSNHLALLLTDGSVRAVGKNTQGQLGVGDTTDRLTPVTVLNISTATLTVFSSASTPVGTPLLSTAAIITYPFIQFPALNLGPVQYPQYQLELTTDYARKLTTSTWTIGSDERLKTDIETANVDRCVEIVQNLDLKRFAWNFPDGSQPPDSHSLGWIAQEFAQFFPNSVDEAPAHGIMDFKNLNSDQIIKVMWGALKKLRADLKSRKSSDSELSMVDDNASPAPESNL